MQADSVWLTETSRISGEVHYKSLQMDRGAALNCRVVHNWNESDEDKNKDIYNSLYDGAKGLVLAAETAIGKNPVLTIKFLKECIDAFNKYKKTKSENFLF